MASLRNLGCQETLGTATDVWDWSIRSGFSTKASFDTTIVQRMAVTSRPEQSKTNGIGVIDMGGSSHAIIKPAGTGADTGTFTLRVYGVRGGAETESLTEAAQCYERDILLVVPCVLCSTAVPSAVALGSSTALYCAGLGTVLDYTREPSGAYTVDPGATLDYPATITIPCAGYRWLETQCAIDSGTATGHNVRYTTF